MTDEWGEPVAGSSQTHDFETSPLLVATYRGSDDVTVGTAEAGDLRVSKMHRFLDERSEQVDVWGSVDLDRKIRDVNPGARVRIQFLGRQAVGGGREMKMFELRVATNTVPAANEPDDEIPF